MEAETRYQYQKIIKDLREQLSQALHERAVYRGICSDIYAQLILCVRDGKYLNNSWIVEKFRSVWK